MLSDHIDGFIAAKNYAETSAIHRRTAIRLFIDTVGDRDPKDLTPADVLRWWGTIGTRAPATRHGYLCAIRQYMRHLMALGLASSDPTGILSSPKVESKPPVCLGDFEAREVIRSAKRPVDRAIVGLLLFCGLRAGDASRLLKSDVDLDMGVLTVLGKGGRYRTVPIPDAAMPLLVEQSAISPDGGHFLISRGKPLKANSVAHAATRMISRAGVKRGAGDMRASHVLRRTCATSMLDTGASIREVQVILGHSSLQSTQRYLAVRDAAALRSVVERAAERWSIGDGDELPHAA